MESGNSVEGCSRLVRVTRTSLSSGKQVEDLRLLGVHGRSFFKQRERFCGATLVEGGLSKIEGDSPGVWHERRGAMEEGNTLVLVRGLDKKRSKKVESTAVLRIFGDSSAKLALRVGEVLHAEVDLAEFTMRPREVGIELQGVGKRGGRLLETMSVVQRLADEEVRLRAGGTILQQPFEDGSGSVHLVQACVANGFKIECRRIAAVEAAAT